MSNQSSRQKLKKKRNDSIDDFYVAPGITLGMARDLLDVIPNTLQADFIDEKGHTIWMTINKDYLTINPDDMALKYGGKIPGEWYVVGLIDALPERYQNENCLPKFPDNPIKDGLTTMLDGIKDMAGRDNNSYGITPLIIFRTIK